MQLQVTQKNRTHKNFIKSYDNPISFKYFAGFKPQSAFNHSPKFHLLKSLRIKVIFFLKYAPNGLHVADVMLMLRAPADRIPYSINVSLCPSTHRPTVISRHISQTFWIKIFHSPILSKLVNPVKNYAFWWSIRPLKLSPKTSLR